MIKMRELAADNNTANHGAPLAGFSGPAIGIEAAALSGENGPSLLGPWPFVHICFNLALADSHRFLNTPFIAVLTFLSVFAFEARAAFSVSQSLANKFGS